MKTTKEKPKNLATPGKPMSQDDFVSFIKETVKGEFMTEKEIWRKVWKMEIGKKKEVRSDYYLNDIQDIFEYGELIFGKKAV